MRLKYLKEHGWKAHGFYGIVFYSRKINGILFEIFANRIETCFSLSKANSVIRLVSSFEDLQDVLYTHNLPTIYYKP